MLTKLRIWAISVLQGQSSSLTMQKMYYKLFLLSIFFPRSYFIESKAVYTLMVVQRSHKIGRQVRTSCRGLLNYVKHILGLGPNKSCKSGLGT